MRRRVWMAAAALAACACAAAGGLDGAFRKRPGAAGDGPAARTTPFEVLAQWMRLNGIERPGLNINPFSKFAFANESAMTKLAVIVCGTKAGTGFLLASGGRVHLVTNAHVVEEGEVRAQLLDGRTLRLGRRETAQGLDLARFEVSGALPAFEAETALPQIGEHVTVFGNSDGRGVITEIKGRVLGVGPRELEIDAAFVSGNSGSPVLNRAGRVAGVATYLRNCRNDADWSKTNTRFNGVRRFALRLAGVRWTAE